MAIHIQTSAPEELLATIKKAIDSQEIGSWSYDKDGDFTYTPKEWANKAWLRFRKAENEVLSFGLVGPRGGSIDNAVRSIYHARFIEMLITHFRGQFDLAAASGDTDVDLDRE